MLWIGILTLIVITFGALMLGVASLLGPKVKSLVKSEPYECGIPVPDEDKSMSKTIPVQFYLTAILFILFDIEIIFMFPWALIYKDGIEAGQGPYLLISMGIFIALFVVGLVWEISSKALDWEK